MWFIRFEMTLWFFEMTQKERVPRQPCCILIEGVIQKVPQCSFQTGSYQIKPLCMKVKFNFVVPPLTHFKTRFLPYGFLVVIFSKWYFSRGIFCHMEVETAVVQRDSPTCQSDLACHMNWYSTVWMKLRWTNDVIVMT